MCVFVEDAKDISVDDRPNSNLEAGRHRGDTIATSLAMHTVSSRKSCYHCSGSVEIQ